MLEGGLTYDYAQIVMDCELLRMVRRVIRGIAVDEERMAVDVIKQAGPAGEFMSQEHTLRYFRQEHSQSRIASRSLRNNWLEEGSKDMTERAYEEARFILKNHKPAPLPRDVQAAFNKIIEEANEYYGV